MLLFRDFSLCSVLFFFADPVHDSSEDSSDEDYRYEGSDCYGDIYSDDRYYD